MKSIKLFVLILFLVAAFAFQTQAQDQNKEGDVFFIVDEMPEYPGGDEALRKDISEIVKYPVEAQKNKISGKVYVTFVVNTEGKIVDSKIARGVNPSLDKEALRVMNILKTWTPGKQNGKAVKVQYTVPINFALDGDSKEKEKNEELSKIDKNEKQVFKIVEDMPEFPGGDLELRKYIANNINYPEDAKKEGIQGKVFITFVVAKDGKTTDTKIARSVHPSLDKEALRVISGLPTWKPGKQRGEAVNVSYTIPINFALENAPKQNEELKQ